MVFTYTPGGFPQHPYGKLEEHLDRLRTALQSTELPTETIESLQDRLEQFEIAARPNDVYYCGYPEYLTQVSAAMDNDIETEAPATWLKEIGESVLTEILDQSVRDLNARVDANDTREACRISYCLGRLEGTLGHLKAEDALEELASSRSATASRNAQNKKIFKSSEHAEYALHVISQYLDPPRIKLSAACNRAKLKVMEHYGLEKISAKTLERAWKEFGPNNATQSRTTS